MAMVRLRRTDPRTVGPYRLLRRLGTGGMGVVFLGADRDGHKVALKLIRTELAGNPEFRSRFAREVESAARVQGPRTVPLVAADPDAARPWLATEYVPGPSLQRRVGQYGPLGALELARVGAAVADGLVSVHAAGVVHRDVKPSNILLSPEGPRIIDFGIAYSDGAGTLTHTGTAVGSPGFLGPEQVRGQQVTPATDIFALGVTLAYAGRGSAPFGSGPVDALLYRVVHEEPLLEGVPESVVPVVAACLAKDAALRPRAEEVRDKLAAIARQEAAGGASGRIDTSAVRARKAPGVKTPPPRQEPVAPETAEKHDKTEKPDSGSHQVPRERRPAGPNTRGGKAVPRKLTTVERRRQLVLQAVVFLIVTAIAAIVITMVQDSEETGDGGSQTGPAGQQSAPAEGP